MAEALKQRPVKLFSSVIFKDLDKCQKAIEEMVRLYGKTEELELNASFDYTGYYEREMGKPLLRKIICFKDLIERDNISKVKHESNRIEDSLKVDGKRIVNIDPGYLTEAKVVLLTTKDYTHRIYIGDRMFAESTLFFRGGSFTPWPWTYPDYASKELRSYFNEARDLYMKDSKRK